MVRAIVYTFDQTIPLGGMPPDLRTGCRISKIAVHSTVQGVDPVGTFVGGHGTRVNAVMSEIGEQEKIDIVVWAEDTKTYITNALSPTKVNDVEIDEANKKAKVIVPEDQLSIAIGKGGQNVRSGGYAASVRHAADRG